MCRRSDVWLRGSHTKTRKTDIQCLNAGLRRIIMNAHRINEGKMPDISKRKNGDEYGWGNCRYDIAENFWGDKLCRSAYKRSPEESLNRIVKHIKKALPKMDEEELRMLL